MRWWRAVKRIPSQYRIFREYHNPRVMSAFKALMITLFRRRVHLGPRWWL